MEKTALFTLIYSVILYLIGLFIYFKDSHITNLVVYMIVWIAFGPLLYHVAIDVIEEEQYYNIIQWVKYLGWSILLFEIPKMLKGERQRIVLLLTVLMAFTYCFFNAFYRGGNFMGSLKFTFGCYLDVLFLVSILDKIINIKRIVKLLRYILYFEIIIGLFEILLSFSFYPSNSEVVGTELTGSFIGANIYAEFLSLVLFFVMYADGVKTKRITPLNFVLFIFVTIIVLYSGVRMALISHILFFGILLICIYSKNKVIIRYKRPVITIGCILCFLFVTVISTYISNSEVSYDSQVSNSLERQNVLVSIFLNDDYLLEHTTLSLSAIALSFFDLNPLFGPGLFFSSPAGYGGMINQTSSNYTDCTLALYLCEVGIIGIVFFLLTYYSVLFKICKSNYGPNLAFLYLLVVTVTDTGIFFFGNYLIFITLVLYSRGLLRNEKGQLSHSCVLNK